MTKAKKVTKQSFVASLPADTTYEDALSKAKAAGLTPFTKAAFHTMRSVANKAKAARRPAKRKAAGKAGKAAPTPRALLEGLDAARRARAPTQQAGHRALVAAVRALGIDQCRVMLDLLDSFARDAAG